jgi:tetratricopeptide (TPR) repeat protein
VHDAVTGSRSTVAEAEKLLRIGEPLVAYNAIREALEEHPDDPRLRQLEGLALARSGALHRANELLSALRDEGHEDGETLGILARTHKDLGLQSADESTRAQHLAAALDIYTAGYRESRRLGAVDEAYYTGINAATVAFLCGQAEQARTIATDVEDLCRQALQDTDPDSHSAYWPRATLAEAALIRGDLDAARERYKAAGRLAGDRYGDLSSTRHQARLLLQHLGQSESWLDDVIRVPPVLVFTGHMIDLPGRQRPRFPPAKEAQVRAAIRARLQSIGPVAAYGSAACGADILCLECMQELGGELHIVLPFALEEFRGTSVDLLPDGDWGARFERLIENATDVLVTGERPPPNHASTFEYANLVMTGLARLRAQMLDTQLQGLAVWDGVEAGDVGGTGSMVSLWRESGVALEHVPTPDADAPATARGTSEVASVTDPSKQTEPAWPFDYEMKAMLFADAVGYSRLSEEQIPLFFEHFVGSIARFNSAGSDRPVHIETAGDGIYMVFDDTAAAGRYALGLSELINERDWESVGLPAALTARVGLHCGPVFVGRDPITGGRLYTGIHTSRTARIEPVTPPGQVYASSAFAAVATARRAAGLRFSYIGHTQLAKDYGILPLYHVKRQD